MSKLWAHGIKSLVSSVDLEIKSKVFSQRNVQASLPPADSPLFSQAWVCGDVRAEVSGISAAPLLRWAALSLARTLLADRCPHGWLRRTPQATVVGTDSALPPQGRAPSP